MSSTLRKTAVVVSAVALTFAAACSSSNNSPSDGSTTSGSNAASSASAAPSSDSGTYTPAEVAAASGSYQVQPLFAVPKKLPKQYRIIFLNNGMSNAFFAAWHQGMTDAAKFYGVDFQDSDLDFKYENELPAYKQLTTAKAPDAVGANVMNDAVYNQIQQDGAKLVMIDGTYKDVPNFGVPDEQVGQLAIKTLEPAAQQKLAGDWKGKTLDVVGMTAPGCPPCDARIKAGFAQAGTDLSVPANHTFMLTPQGQDPTTASQSTFADFLTAHPNDVVLVFSYGDEPPLGAIAAAKAAGRTGDILAVTNGGDAAARAALRQSSNDGILVGVIDYQPYAEGWNFIEAAIATVMGKQFSAYQVTRVLTSSNVDTYYPNDK